MSNNLPQIVDLTFGCVNPCVIFFLYGLNRAPYLFLIFDLTLFSGHDDVYAVWLCRETCSTSWMHQIMADTTWAIIVNQPLTVTRSVHAGNFLLKLNREVPLRLIDSSSAFIFCSTLIESHHHTVALLLLFRRFDRRGQTYRRLG